MGFWQLSGGVPARVPLTTGTRLLFSTWTNGVAGKLNSGPGASAPVHTRTSGGVCGLRGVGVFRYVKHGIAHHILTYFTKRIRPAGEVGQLWRISFGVVHGDWLCHLDDSINHLKKSLWIMTS